MRNNIIRILLSKKYWFAEVKIELLGISKAMSINFVKFLIRIGKESEFKPLKNSLVNSLQKDSSRKYKNYPKLLEIMKSHWPQYQAQSRISHLLRDHYEEIFTFLLNTIFPFRKRGLSLEDPEAPTPVDFKLVYKYHYNKKEIEAIEQVMKELNIDGNVDGVVKRLLIFSISSFAPLVEEIFQRPFAFQFSNIDLEELPDGEKEVIAVISGREQ
ncbi:MAG: hypothetical protein JW891_01920 [Candidatus Lokiarchaeota archaeon]|nr:hypothetical protein [Candidatus Lokiarchaeota archaeon]